MHRPPRFAARAARDHGPAARRGAARLSVAARTTGRGALSCSAMAQRSRTDVPRDRARGRSAAAIVLTITA
ncbi:hypothetical protein PAI11_26330 [Patulibacter medicamentivorans]|uniref:Uncharacterized protein n=1 Tax=Patulibacter medicamentivorans TaxID=1097667 RepID=H0E731_9ACTN|nr:hypothetical protein PAI11_26330 [Patulibacter medicamentivorans]